MPDSAASLKQDLRQEVRARLKTLGATNLLQSSLRIAEHVLEFPAWQQANTICLFASLPSEPETRALIEHAWTTGKRVALPRIHDTETRLSLHWVKSLEDLERGSKGFEGPRADAEIAAIGDMELVLIPGLAFDRLGGRLGRGGGYYDRLLAEPSCRAVLLGLFFSIQEVAHIPRESWDHPIQWIATEEECFRIIPDGIKL